METRKAKFAIDVAFATATLMYLGAGGCGDEGEPARPDGPAFGSPEVGGDAGASGIDAGAPSQPDNDAGAAAQGAADASASDPLPCEVETFLHARCTSCHGSPPLPGVPGSLGSYADLMKPSTHPDQTVAQRALELVQSGAMPPGVRLSASEVQSFAGWVQAGAQPSACTIDAGASPSAPPPASVCTSRRYWKEGNEGSPQMHPGKACIACHESDREEEGPRFSIAGTVFPSLFEPDDCFGASGGGLQVVIKGADGRTLTLTPNGAGNFYAEQRIAMPYTAELRYQGRVRSMAQPQSNGDCNGCHTERGASGAPGRILSP